MIKRAAVNACLFRILVSILCRSKRLREGIFLIRFDTKRLFRFNAKNLMKDFKNIDLTVIFYLNL